MQIHRRQSLPSQQKPLNILHRRPFKTDMRVHRTPSIMRHHHHPPMPRQPRMHIRLLSMNIQPRSRDLPFIQRPYQRLLINQ